MVKPSCFSYVKFMLLILFIFLLLNVFYVNKVNLAHIAFQKPDHIMWLSCSILLTTAIKNLFC